MIRNDEIVAARVLRGGLGGAFFMPVLDANESWMARRRTRTNEKQSAKLVFFTQITMEAAEDVEFLSAMNAARVKGALVSSLLRRA